MATLSENDLEKLFSGAPQYFARSEGHFTGAPHPSVAFPWDESLAIRDLTDHIQIEDEAWGCITAWPHITRDVTKSPSASASRRIAAKKRAHFYPRCRERPAMLSMQGLEKGTMGYQAALEMDVADAIKDGELVDPDHEARQAMLKSKDGLRRLDEGRILDFLAKNAARYQDKHCKDKAACDELYKELFRDLLHPQGVASGRKDPSTLTSQIFTLVNILKTPRVWIDFSRVDWRIRLGAVLWAGDSNREGTREATTDGDHSKQEDKYWLLLQVLLACELLIRLDIITEGDELPHEVKPSEILRFEKDANETVKWSLHLARAWLENIDIVKADGPIVKKPRGWLTHLTQRMSLSPSSGDKLPHSHHHDRQQSRKDSPLYNLTGKHSQRQIRGLTHFARRIKWPGIEMTAGRIQDACKVATEKTPLPTPLGSPKASTTDAAAYFSDALKQQNGSADKDVSAKQRKLQELGALAHPSGWLLKSFVSGLMLPGEGLGHLIMCALIASDGEAKEQIGSTVHMHGGFVYMDKSFWNSACIVGRVLAAGNGAVECLGWISSDVLPLGLTDGWVGVEAAATLDDKQHTGRSARIWDKASIERGSNIVGAVKPLGLLCADFIMPTEDVYTKPPPTLGVELTGLHLRPSQHASNGAVAADNIVPHTASMTFNVLEWDTDEDTSHTLSLKNDIHFVTAHPCVRSPNVKLMKSSSSPTVQRVEMSWPDHPDNTALLTKCPGHPLHKSYVYTVVHLSELLDKPDLSLNQLVQRDRTGRRASVTPATMTSANNGVVVIDAITNFLAQPDANEVPLSPITTRSSGSFSRTMSNQSAWSFDISQSSYNDMSPGANAPAPPRTPTPSLAKMRSMSTSSGILIGPGGEKISAEHKMHSETRRRQFGSDMEILVRAICAERGWNALISRKRRGCLACAIREAGALGWRVVVRVD